MLNLFQHPSPHGAAKMLKQVQHDEVGGDDAAPLS